MHPQMADVAVFGVHCQLEPCEGGGGCLEARVCSLSGVLWAHCAQGDVPPDGVTLGADLSIRGTGEEVSTGMEVVADGAERSQEPLGVLG
jgi:hypothetical protein